MGVGIVALLAVAVAIHLRVGLLHERAKGEKLQAAALASRRKLKAGLMAAGIHVLEARNKDAAGLENAFDSVSDILTAADSQQVRDALGELSPSSKALSMDCAGRMAGETYHFDGFAAADSEITLILRNITEDTAQAVDLNAEIEHLRTLFDALEMPIWQRAGDLGLTWCNKSYARHVDSSPRRVMREHGPELISGMPREEARTLTQGAIESREENRERHHVVVGGERRLLEIVETPLGDGGGTTGWAQDIGELEQAESDLNRHIEAHVQVLQSLNTSIAIYALDTRLTFFNSEFVKLFKLEEGWLVSEPTLSEILEAQREQGRLPEQADWRQYKKRMNGIFPSRRRNCCTFRTARPSAMSFCRIRSAACNSWHRMLPTGTVLSAIIAASPRFSAPRSTICSRRSPCSAPMTGCNCRTPNSPPCGSSIRSSWTASPVSPSSPNCRAS